MCLFQPYILPTIQGKHQDLKSISTETVSCAGTFLLVLSPSSKPVWCCCFCCFLHCLPEPVCWWCFWVCLFLHCFPKPVWWWCFWGCFFYTAPPNQSGGVFKKIFFYIAPPNQSGGGGFFCFCFLHCSPKPVWLVVVFLVCLFYTAPPNQSGGGVFVCVCCFYTAPPNQLGGGGVLHWVNEVAVCIVSIHTCKLPQLQNAFMAHNIYNRILHCTLCFCKVDLIKNSEFQCRNTKNRTQTWKGSMTKKVVYIHCLCLFDSCHTWWAWRIVFIGQLSQ